MIDAREAVLNVAHEIDCIITKYETYKEIDDDNAEQIGYGTDEPENYLIAAIRDLYNWIIAQSL